MAPKPAYLTRGRPTHFVETDRTLAVPDAGGFALAVVADTHSRPHDGLWAALEAVDPCAILHAGDVGDLAVLDRLSTIAPVVAVRGNIDARGQGLPDAVALTLTAAAGPILRLYLTHIGVRTTRLLPDPRRRAGRAGAALVVCGHSHVPLVAKDGPLAVLNPGSAGPRRFRLPIVFGVIEVRPVEVRLRHVDCETGRRWRPPQGR